ncbi:MAG: hypothetical protein J7L90_00965 [Dehalococcoidia bacterium]|nr:hypothetical protein [Dehalococcoidia bacterium]
MAVEIGTATDYLDLAAKLKTFLTTNADLVAASQEWICNRDDGTEMLFQGPGLSGAEEIFIGLKYFSDVGNDIYSWDIASFLGYTPENIFDNQPGRVLAKDAFFPLWDDSTPYWFIANGQRVIVVAKVSTTYQSMYLGKFLPYGTPGQYPYPVFWGGMTNNPAYKYSSTAAGLRFFPYAYSMSCYIYLPSGIISPSGGQTQSPTATVFNIYPFCDNSVSTSMFGKMAPFDNGDVQLIQSILRIGTARSADCALLGELDGVFWVHGTAQSSETIVTIDSVDYLVFQDGSKVERNNFAAVRLT